MKKLFYLIILCIILSACGANNSQENGDYEKTKKMVIDILQTEDGKKALTETLQDEKIKQELVIQSEIVQSAIDQGLTSEKGKKMWKSLFEDPSFVEGYAKSMNEEHMKLMKDLMKDAEYQKQMLDLLQNPEITSQMLKLMTSQQFRSHLEKTIQETLDTPLFKAKMQEILLKAAQEQQKQQSGGSGSESGGGGEQGEGNQEGK